MIVVVYRGHSLHFFPAGAQMSQYEVCFHSLIDGSFQATARFQNSDGVEMYFECAFSL